MYNGESKSINQKILDVDTIHESEQYWMSTPCVQVQLQVAAALQGQGFQDPELLRMGGGLFVTKNQ